MKFALACVLILSFGVLPSRQIFAATVTTANGPVEIAARPEVIAVYDIAAIDTLHALGVPMSGVPNELYLPTLRKGLATVPTVGTLFEPDLEALNSIHPDLVIIGGRSSTQREHVERVAPVIDMTIWGTSLLEEARQRISDYGLLFDRQAGAATLLSAFDRTISAARAAAAGKGNALIVMTNGPKISAYGRGSRFGFLYDALDIEPAASHGQPGIHGDAVSFEFLATADPDWLLVLDRAAAIGSGEQNARATLDNEIVRGTTVWKKDQIVFLPSEDLYLAAGGAEATQRVFEALRKAFAGSE